MLECADRHILHLSGAECMSLNSSTFVTPWQYDSYHRYALQLNPPSEGGGGPLVPLHGGAGAGCYHTADMALFRTWAQFGIP